MIEDALARRPRRRLPRRDRPRPRRAPRRHALSREQLLLPFHLRDRRVEADRRTSATPTAPASATCSTSTRRASGVEQRAGAAADPRRRLDDRRQVAAGPPAHAAPRRRGLGVRREQLPAQPEGDVPRPPRRLQAGPRVGPRAHRRVRRRPRLRRGHRRLGRRPPRRADRRSPRTTPQYQPGFEDVDTRVAGGRPVLRRLRPRSTRSRRPTAGRRRVAGEARPEDDDRREPRAVRVRLTRAPGRRRRAAVLRDPRRPRQPRPRRARRGRSSPTLPAVSDRPVAYAEIAGGSHAFDVFHSVRTGQRGQRRRPVPGVGLLGVLGGAARAPASTRPIPRSTPTVDPPTSRVSAAGRPPTAAAGGR